jgi:hypothetical protein
MALTFVDAVLFAGLQMWFGTMWAPILAHGMNNSPGLTTYYLAGPVYGRPARQAAEVTRPRARAPRREVELGSRVGWEGQAR